jgi:hypothetical protein
VTGAWLALLDAVPAGGPRALARAAVTERGAPAGVLCAWRGDAARPVPSARRIDGRVVDPAGPPALVSLVLAPAGVRLPFDDPAVQQARRDALAAPWPRLLTTLVEGDSVFAGALTAFADGPRLDPFARIFPARVLDVGAGLLAASVPAPAGPVVERYGGANPWPVDRFAAT